MLAISEQFRRSGRSQEGGGSCGRPPALQMPSQRCSSAPRFSRASRCTAQCREPSLNGHESLGQSLAASTPRDEPTPKRSLPVPLSLQFAVRILVSICRRVPDRPAPLDRMQAQLSLCRASGPLAAASQQQQQPQQPMRRRAGASSWRAGSGSGGARRLQRLRAEAEERRGAAAQTGAVGAGRLRGWCAQHSSRCMCLLAGQDHVPPCATHRQAQSLRRAAAAPR